MNATQEIDKIIDQCHMDGTAYARRVGAADHTTALQHECGALAGHLRRLAAENEELRRMASETRHTTIPEDGYAVDAAGTFTG
jgi:hypothetical protein